MDFQKYALDIKQFNNIFYTVIQKAKYFHILAH